MDKTPARSAAKTEAVFFLFVGLLSALLFLFVGWKWREFSREQRRAAEEGEDNFKEAATLLQLRATCPAILKFPRCPFARVDVAVAMWLPEAERRTSRADAWGRPLAFSCERTPDGGAWRVVLWSNGRDGLPGSHDDLRCVCELQQ